MNKSTTVDREAKSVVSHQSRSLHPSLARLVSYSALETVVAVLETLAIVLASFAAAVLYSGIVYSSVRDQGVYVGVAFAAALPFILFARAADLYSLSNLLTPRRAARPIIVAWSLTILCLAMLAFLLKVGAQFSRGYFVAFGIVGIIALLGIRKTVAQFLLTALQQDKLVGRRAIVIGILDEVTRHTPHELLLRYGVTQVGSVVIGEGNDQPTLSSKDVLALNSVIESGRRMDIDEIVLALPWDNSWRIQDIRERLRILPLPVRLVADRNVEAVLKAAPVFASGRSLSLELQRAPLNKYERMQKRVFDVALAGVALVTLAPLLLATTLAIKLDSPGPVIFRQRRSGFGGRSFTILKFRTMNVTEDGDKIVQAKKSDNRVTRIGRILRRTSIDELPQLFNVWRGDMSMIGPRPHALAHDDHYSAVIDNYAFRHHMKPGITGWAQVQGLRGETAQLGQMRDRVELDLWYINNWSLWLDFKILFRTCFALLDSKSAY